MRGNNSPSCSPRGYRRRHSVRRELAHAANASLDKANFLITTIDAILVAVLVGASYGSSWLGVLLLSIPFVALGVAGVAAATSLAGMATIRLFGWAAFRQVIHAQNAVGTDGR
jgi:hypothetical protein